MWTISQYLHYLSCNNRLLAEHWVETCSSILIWVRKWLSQCCLASFCSFYASCEGANCRSKNCCGANCLGANHWSASCCLTWKLTFMRDSCARACCRTSLIKRNRSLSGSSSRRYWNTILSWASTASALFRVAKGVCDANRVVFPFNVFCCNCKQLTLWSLNKSSKRNSHHYPKHLLNNAALSMLICFCDRLEVLFEVKFEVYAVDVRVEHC